MWWRTVRALAPESLKNRLRKFVWMRLNPSWTLNSGLLIRVLNYNDWMIYNDIFVEGEYDAAIEDLLDASHDGSRPLQVLDLGGNVGFFTLRLAHLLLRADRPNFRVTMVEGSPSTYAELLERLGANKQQLGDRVTAVHGLAGNRTGEAQIVQGVAHGENTIFGGASRGARVSFVDLGELTATWPRIDLLKCDIEGAEEIFLGSYADLLEKTDRAVFEFHHDKCDVAHCRRLLADAGLNPAKTIREFGHCSVELFLRSQNR
jgi:FkbM family methyltransferase